MTEKLAIYEYFVFFRNEKVQIVWLLILERIRDIDIYHIEQNSH